MKPYESGYFTSRCFAPSSKLAWCKIELYSSLLIALLRVKTVNLSELATGFSGKAQTNSLQTDAEVFRHYEMNYAEIAQAVVA